MFALDIEVRRLEMIATATGGASADQVSVWRAAVVQLSDLRVTHGIAVARISELESQLHLQGSNSVVELERIRSELASTRTRLEESLARIPPSGKTAKLPISFKGGDRSLWAGHRLHLEACIQADYLVYQQPGRLHLFFVSVFAGKAQEAYARFPFVSTDDTNNANAAALLAYATPILDRMGRSFGVHKVVQTQLGLTLWAKCYQHTSPFATFYEEFIEAAHLLSRGELSAADGILYQELRIRVNQDLRWLVEAAAGLTLPSADLFVEGCFRFDHEVVRSSLADPKSAASNDTPDHLGTQFHREAATGSLRDPGTVGTKPHEEIPTDYEAKKAAE